MKDYDENKESSYLTHCGVNNFCGSAMPQELPVNDFKLVEDISELNEIFMNSYNEESHEGYFLKVDIQYLENLHNFHNDLLFLPEIMKVEKVEKVIANLHDKIECVIHIKIQNKPKIMD